MAGDAAAKEPGVVIKLSPRPVDDTVARLADILGLDLPLKVLVWDDAGQTKVSYYAPGELAARHRLGPGLAGNLAAIDTLTDALVAP
jgi:hypothetical protein